MTRPLTSGDEIASALALLIVKAPLEEQNVLFATLARFRTKYYRSYAAVRRQPFTAKLLDAIDAAEEETDNRQSGDDCCLVRSPGDVDGDLDEADRRAVRPHDYE